MLLLVMVFQDKNENQTITKGSVTSWLAGVGELSALGSVRDLPLDK